MITALIINFPTLPTNSSKNVIIGDDDNFFFNYFKFSFFCYCYCFTTGNRAQDMTTEIQITLIVPVIVFVSCDPVFSWMKIFCPYDFPAFKLAGSEHVHDQFSRRSQPGWVEVYMMMFV